MNPVLSATVQRYLQQHWGAPDLRPDEFGTYRSPDRRLRVTIDPGTGVSASLDGSAIIRVASQAVTGVHTSWPLLELVNGMNSEGYFCRTYWDDHAVTVEAHVLESDLTAERLGHVCDHVADFALEWGPAFAREARNIEEAARAADRALAVGRSLDPHRHTDQRGHQAQAVLPDLSSYSYVNITCGEGFMARNDEDAQENARLVACEDVHEGWGLTVLPADTNLPDKVRELLNTAQEGVEALAGELRRQQGSFTRGSNTLSGKRKSEEPHGALRLVSAPAVRPAAVTGSHRHSAR